MKSQQLLVYLLWLIVALVSVLAVYRGISLFSPKDELSFEQLVTSTSNKPVSADQVASGIQRQALFGKVQNASPVIKPVKPKNLIKPLPPLNVEIMGLLAATQGNSIVTLRHSGISESLKEGDFLNMTQTVRVLSISSNRVVFEREGQETVIEVEERKPTEQIVEVRSDNRVVVTISDKQSRRFMQQVLAEVKKNPSRLNHYVRFESTVAQGQSILPGKDPRFFTIMPFKFGDKLISVNNSPLSEMDTQAFAEALTSQTNVKLEMLRNNQPYNIELVIN